MIKLLNTAGFAALLLALAAAAPARAALLERDLASPFDAAITYDTKTTFEWLDLTNSFGMSYNDALASLYVTKLGFRIATPDEVLQLWADVDIHPGLSFENLPGTNQILNRMGCTAQCYPGVSAAAQGWMDLGDPLMTAYSFVQRASLPPAPNLPNIAAADATMNDVPFASRDLRITNSSNGTGVWLVRQAAPEPATWLMMILGFGLTGAALRRRRGDMIPIPVTAPAKPRRQ